jgi:drug/metabolite transporter (DMT)-like permease
VVAALCNGERPSGGFWIWCILGALLVAVYALRRGGGQFHLADLALLGAVVSAAWGYAEGARLTPTLGGWRVISWALVLSAPPLALVLALGPRSGLQAVSSQAWLAFAYVALISQFLAFFAWYRGLALGGVARVAQLQLLMPFFTLAASAVLLGEKIPVSALVFAILVLGTVTMGARSRRSQPD